MRRGIFISYRRDDSRHAAGRLADDLAQVFGAQTIFRDIEGIDPGVDFTKALERALADCVVMLVLIGPGWLDQRDPQGRRRLDQPDDWIRLEVATALRREIRVMPVLLEGARRPEAADLPEDLAVLAVRQTLEMSDSRWRGDLQRLIDALGRVPELASRGQALPVGGGPTVQPTASSGRWPLKPVLTGIAAGVIGLLVLAAWLDEEGMLDDVGALPSQPVNMPPGGDPPPVSAAEAAVADISGLWRTTTGEVYHFEQSGRQVEFVAEVAGQTMGHGSGGLDGQLLRLTLTTQLPGMPMAQARCELTAGPGLQSFAGMCVGPNGPFAAQMFR